MSVPNPFAPVVTPAYTQSVIGAEERREWWRWHFAGQILAGSHANSSIAGPQALVNQAVQAADLLIEALEIRE
jgi:hypothetical protein